MIAHKDFESNCKRIAKYIMKQATNTRSEQFATMVDFGVVIVYVSSALIDDFNTTGKKKYEKEINNNLKGCSVKYQTHGFPNWFIKFEIEFDDVDPEVEDW